MSFKNKIVSLTLQLVRSPNLFSTDDGKSATPPPPPLGPPAPSPLVFECSKGLTIKVYFWRNYIFDVPKDPTTLFTSTIYY